MKAVRIEAIKLRKQGKSYSEISHELGVAKSTLSGWLQNVSLASAAQKRLQQRVRIGLENGLIKRNQLQTKHAQYKAKTIQLEYKNKIGTLSKRELMLIGAALYWGEGYKKEVFRNGKTRTYHPISFVNSDPVMIRTFITFLRTILNVKESEMHLTMRLYKHINEEVARKYWRGVSGLKNPDFKKTTWLISGASKRKRPIDSLPHGTLLISVYRTEKFHQLMGLIEGLKNENNVL